MGKQIGFISTLMASGMALAPIVGCGGTPAHQVNETQSITTVNAIDIQDFNQAADDMSRKLIASGVLDQSPHHPAVMAITGIRNNTGRQIDTDLLLKTIRTNILATGKVQTSTTVGLGGNAEDPLAKDLVAKNQFNGTAAPVASPDYTLSGKIIQERSHAGNLKQSVFVFQLSLTDGRTGNAVWEGDKQIIKQGSQSNVGF